MYNRHEYLSCIKIPATKQATTKNAHKPEKVEPMDFAANHRDLISAANKVFGEGKWNHTVTSQTLDFVEIVGAKCYAGCVSFVKVQLENGNFHEDIGYYSAEESTKGLSIHNARIGSAVNALKRVLLSFGDSIERALQKQRKQTGSIQANDVQRSMVQSSDMQIQENSNALIKEPISCVPQIERRSPEPNKDSDLLITEDPSLPVNNATTESNPSSTKIQGTKTVEPLPNNKINSIIEQKLEEASSAREIQRMERKRKQMEKQMEFKRRMMEKEGLMSSDSKPNPRY